MIEHIKELLDERIGIIMSSRDVPEDIAISIAEKEVFNILISKYNLTEKKAMEQLRAVK